MRHAFVLGFCLLAACGGFLRHQAASTTADLLVAAQPSLQQESDYELAARALPGALKTIEGFYVADEQPKLRAVLTEGYCQYATAFVEDEWEIADFAKNFDLTQYQNERAGKMFARCLNYALMDLPKGFDKDLYGGPDQIAARVKTIGPEYKRALLWAGIGLGGLVQHNLTNVDAMALLPNITAILGRVIELDAADHGPCDSECVVSRALPHLALGMLNSAVGTQFGGDPKKATEEFQAAINASADASHPDGRFLLARTMYAYKVGKQTNDRKLFHDQLVKVLQTDPAIWPEQRLANEVAQRRARRYLSHEKDWYP